MLEEIIESRVKKSKSSIVSKDLKGRAERNLLSLRKNQIEDYLNIRRKVTNYENLVYQIKPENLLLDSEYLIDLNVFLSKFDINFLSKFYLYNEDSNVMKYGLYILRKYITSPGLDAVLPRVMNDGILIDHLCHLLTFPDNTVKYEASWILINSVNHLDFVSSRCEKEENLISIYTFFTNADEHLLEHSLWLIGNVTAANKHNRYRIIKFGVLERLAFLLDDFSISEDLKENIVWVLCNLSRGNLNQIHLSFLDIIPPLIKYFYTSVDEKELLQCLFIIFKLTSQSSDHILQKFLRVEFYKRLISLMTEYSLDTKLYCLKVIANMTSSSDVQTQFLINEGILEVYKSQLEDQDFSVVKETLWGLSNICAGSISQIERLFQCGIPFKILKIAHNLTDMLGVYINGTGADKLIFQTLKECAFCICNLLSGGKKDNRVILIQNGSVDLIRLLVQFMQLFREEQKLIEVNLLAIKNLFEIQDEGELMCDEKFDIKYTFLKNGLEEILIQNDFHNSMNETIYKYAVDLLDDISLEVQPN